MSKGLLAPQSEKVRTLELSIEEIRQAKDELIRISNDSTQRELYDMRANSLRDKMLYGELFYTIKVRLNYLNYTSF